LPNKFPCRSSLAKSDPFLSVELRGTEIIVRKADFYAVYCKPTNQPQLILRRRSDPTTTGYLPELGKLQTTKRVSLGGSSKKSERD